MDWSALATVVVGVVGLGGVVLQRRYTRARGRDRAKADLELLALLPEDSAVRKDLRDHIDETIRHVIEVEDGERRDTYGIVLAILFLIIGGCLFWAFSAHEVWWLALAGGFFVLFGFVGLSLDAPRRTRDARGNAI
ncbi:SLC19 family protein [Streptomyces sp. SCSIO ZS0520]|uniref:SLC19 family protein n=1 Tax=Streptomyces sp. SCSIO ZS0520 TaxID=2892996 RepID=UPI0021D91D59|nr:SLC19 family protein [Streptomyces sp. SCSIO ZS0520]